VVLATVTQRVWPLEEPQLCAACAGVGKAMKVAITVRAKAMRANEDGRRIRGANIGPS
jgi:hypothetical protein